MSTWFLKIILFQNGFLQAGDPWIEDEKMIALRLFSW
jgi:hypothetical protein